MVRHRLRPPQPNDPCYPRSMQRAAPREIALHLARTTDAGDPYSFPYRKGQPGACRYLRTRADGTSADAEIAWDEGIFSDLQGLRGAPPDPARLPSLGGRLRGFLEPLGW